MTSIIPFNGHLPHCGEDVFIAPGAKVIGRVTIGPARSVFYNTVIRGDINDITIGSRTNIQDSCTLHVTTEHSLQVGDGITAGHNVILHGCSVGDNVTVGMGAIILDGTSVGADSIVAAGSLLPPGKHYPAGSLILGSPARVVRPLTEAEKEKNRQSAERYVMVKDEHRRELQKYSETAGI